tara:strand:- start:3143 stop:3943 length:801 start_codon:yes stop_codon:yes gene_type:complete
MRIITLAEYYGDEKTSVPQDNYYKMMKLWIHHINMFASECHVEFLYTKEENNWLFFKDFQNFIKRYDNLNITFKKITTEVIGRVPNGRGHVHRHQCLFNHKLSVLKNEPKPYVWMDIDVYLFSPLKDFYKHLDNHPLVGTGHGSYVRDQTEVFNSGLYAIKEDFLDLESGLKTCLEVSDAGACHDQNVTHYAMKNINYSPFVFEDHIKWNWWGVRCNYVKDNNGNFTQCTNKEGEKVHASHFWGLQKPWRHGDSKPFWEESMRQIL